jgi:alpha-1,2-mannosyltransferase
VRSPPLAFAPICVGHMAVLRLLPVRWSDELLSREPIYAASLVFLAAELSVFLFMIAGTHGLIVPLDRPNTTDFVSFYAAGKLAGTAEPQLAYNQAEHLAEEERVREPGIVYNFFYYPPTYLLLCNALGHLPYLAAFLSFETAGLLLYLLVARRILDDPDWSVLVPLLAFAPVFWTLGLGQNSLLTAALFGAATLFVDRRPAAAGILFGCICYKPHFALLVPVALAAGRRWRVLTAAFLTTTAFCLLSLLAFGWQTWHDFFVAAGDSSAIYASGRIPFIGFVNPFGAVRQLGGPENIAYAVQAGAMLAAAALVGFTWGRRLPLPIRAASLASAALVAAPVALFYDLMLAGIAALWLLRGSGKDSLLEWEKITLVGLFLLSLNPRRLAEVSHLPIGPLIAAALTALIAARAIRYRAVCAEFAQASLNEDFNQGRLSPGIDRGFS